MGFVPTVNNIFIFRYNIPYKMSKIITALLIYFFAPLLCTAQAANTTAKYNTIQINKYSKEGKDIITNKLDSFYKKRLAGGFSGQVLIGFNGNIFYERYIG